MSLFEKNDLPSIEDIKRRKKEIEKEAKIAGQNAIKIIGDGTVMCNYEISKEQSDKIKKDVDRFFEDFKDKN